VIPIYAVYLQRQETNTNRLHKP